MADKLDLLKKEAHRTRRDVSRGSVRILFCTGPRDEPDPDGHLHVCEWTGQQHRTLTDEEAQALLDSEGGK